MISFLLINNAILLGVGLAMDAFSVSIANGISIKNISRGRLLAIPLVFAIYQAIMPLLGYVAVFSVSKKIEIFSKITPYISLGLLLYIGIKLIIDGKNHKENQQKEYTLTFMALMIQGVATSIDALSVGFTIASYTFIEAVITSIIISVVTFIICLFGVILGKKIGNKFSKYAVIIGGIILIIIGAEIFIKSFF